MITFLDLLIIVSMALIAAGLLSVVLMFAIRNRIVRRVCFYIAIALSFYVGYVGIAINWPDFFSQAVIAVAMILLSMGALVLSFIPKNSQKLFLIARIIAAAALAVGTVNALLI